MLPTSVRVVIADGDAGAAEALAVQLRAAGHHVHLAQDDTRALTLAELLRPDVVLLDLDLKSVGGEELARQMRSAHWGVAIQLIAIGEPQAEQQGKLHRDAFDEYVTRPVDVDVLLQLISPRTQDPPP